MYLEMSYLEIIFLELMIYLEMICVRCVNYYDCEYRSGPFISGQRVVWAFGSKKMLPKRQQYTSNSFRT